MPGRVGFEQAVFAPGKQGVQLTDASVDASMPAAEEAEEVDNF